MIIKVVNITLHHCLVCMVGSVQYKQTTNLLSREEFIFIVIDIYFRPLISAEDDCGCKDALFTTQ